MSRKVLIGVVVGVILVVAGGAAAGFVLGQRHPAKANKESVDDYPLLARRLFVDNPNDPILNFAQLRQQMRNYYDANKLSGSIYFEYLPTGTSIRIADDDQQVAASLMKVPKAMELYKAAEMGKINLDQTITLKPEWLDSNFGNLYKKGAGYQLTLREAAKIMLQDSDNTALRAIAANTDGLLTQQQMAYNSLDVDVLQNPNLTLSIGARSYSSFLKCLYFACYANKADSQEILQALAHSDSEHRLTAGISDPSIVVAHKVGLYNQDAQSDCGIIYLPNRNYVLCAILKGEDNATSDQHIADISKMVYEFLTNIN
jgi:beta-lactamase class A